MCGNPGPDNDVLGKTCIITVSVPENVYLTSPVLKAFLLQIIIICLRSVEGNVLVMRVCLSVCLSVDGGGVPTIQGPVPTPLYRAPVPPIHIFKYVQVGQHCAVILPPRADMLKLVHYVACTVRKALS